MSTDAYFESYDGSDYSWANASNWWSDADGVSGGNSFGAAPVNGDFICHYANSGSGAQLNTGLTITTCDMSLQTTSSGIIFGGTFTGDILLNSGSTVSGGYYTGNITDNGATWDITGTLNGYVTFMADITVEVGGEIAGGAFSSGATMTNYGIISGGEIYSAINNYGAILGGFFEAVINNYGTISGGHFQTTTINNYSSGNVISGVLCDDINSTIYSNIALTITNSVLDTCIIFADACIITGDDTDSITGTSFQTDNGGSFVGFRGNGNWTGAADNGDISDRGNWTFYPNSSAYTGTIPASLLSYPDHGTFDGNLIVNSGATITMNYSGTFVTLNGTVTNYGLMTGEQNGSTWAEGLVYGDVDNYGTIQGINLSKKITLRSGSVVIGASSGYFQDMPPTVIMEAGVIFDPATINNIRFTGVKHFQIQDSPMFQLGAGINGSSILGMI